MAVLSGVVDGSLDKCRSDAPLTKSRRNSSIGKDDDVFSGPRKGQFCVLLIFEGHIIAAFAVFFFD